MTEVVLLLAVLGGATAFGVWRRQTDGRMRVVAHEEILDGMGDRGAGSADLDPLADAQGQPTEAPAIEADTSGLPPGSGTGQATLPAEDVSQPLVVEGSELGPADHAVVPAANVLAAADLGEALGERATLVQFSSAFCQPCRATRLVLADVARTVPGVAHVEIDAESHLDLVRRVDVTRTPTVLILDSAGRIRTRATGAPRSGAVLTALASIL